MIRYAITDRALFGSDEAARIARLRRQMGELARAEVDFVQLREKDLPAAALVKLARTLLTDLQQGLERGETRGASRPRLLVNGRADVAMAAGADGVHLPSWKDEMTARQVREVFTRAGLGRPAVSVSCHGREDVERVAGEEDGPDLILFGPVFEKVVRLGAGVKPNQPAIAKVSEGCGLETLRLCCAAAAPVPVLALGGVADSNVRSCLEAGAAGIAAIRLFAHVDLHR